VEEAPNSPGSIPLSSYPRSTAMVRLFGCQIARFTLCPISHLFCRRIPDPHQFLRHGNLWV
jgi:hypothetical protein